MDGSLQGVGAGPRIQQPYDNYPNKYQSLAVSHAQVQPVLVEFERLYDISFENF